MSDLFMHRRSPERLADARLAFELDFGGFESRTRSRRRGLLGALFVCFLVACSPVPDPVVPSPEPMLVPDMVAPEHFSGEVAEAHIAWLAHLGSRPARSANDQAARRYLEEQFELVGAATRIVEDGLQRHLIARIPGESDDVLLLVAAYPVLEFDEWIGDSGAGFLVEMARVLALERPLYTLDFALAEVAPYEENAAGAALEVSLAVVPSSAILARRQILAAGESLARSLAEKGDFENLRGVLVFERPARPNLRIARDLRSHPVYRDVFWASARSLGFGTTFPKDAGWASAQSLHLGFKAREMDRVLALVDESLARPEVPPDRVNVGRSSASLTRVGLVTHEALMRIMHRLSRIDAFSAAGEQAESSGQASPQIIEKPPST